MANGTWHVPCIPRHWAMGCPAWTSTETSHNKVNYKISPNTDVTSISGVLHLVWPLRQSLTSMVKPTRSRNSSWHSIWDRRGTQAPPLRQSNNTLGGNSWTSWWFLTVWRSRYVNDSDQCYPCNLHGIANIQSTSTLPLWRSGSVYVVCGKLQSLREYSLPPNLYYKPHLNRQ